MNVPVLMTMNLLANYLEGKLELIRIRRNTSEIDSHWCQTLTTQHTLACMLKLLLLGPLRGELI